MARSTRPDTTAVATLGPASRSALAALAVLLAVGIAQLSDLLTFLRMIAIAGLGAELNPLVAHTAAHHGTDLLAFAKLALVVFVAAVFAVLAPRHARMAGAVATIGTFAGLIGAYSNFLAII